MPVRARALEQRPETRDADASSRSSSGRSGHSLVWDRLDQFSAEDRKEFIQLFGPPPLRSRRPDWDWEKEAYYRDLEAESRFRGRLHRELITDSLGRIHHGRLMAVARGIAKQWLDHPRFKETETIDYFREILKVKVDFRGILSGLQPGTDRVRVRRALDWITIEQIRRLDVAPANLTPYESGASSDDLVRAMDDLREHFYLGPYARLRFSHPDRGDEISDRAGEALQRVTQEFNDRFEDRTVADRWLRRWMARYAHAEVGTTRGGRTAEAGRKESVKFTRINVEYDRLKPALAQDLLFNHPGQLWRRVEPRINRGLPKGTQRKPSPQRVSHRVFREWLKQRRDAISRLSGRQEPISSRWVRNQIRLVIGK